MSRVNTKAPRWARPGMSLLQLRVLTHVSNASDFSDPEQIWLLGCTLLCGMADHVTLPHMLPSRRLKVTWPRTLGLLEPGWMSRTIRILRHKASDKF